MPFVAARARGVDVKILVPGPFHNKPAVRRASRRTWARLLPAEVELYEHQRTTVHAKVVIADGIVTMVGTINFDPRSFAFNTECAAMAVDADLAAQAARAFASDVTASRRVVADDLGRRSLVDRALDAVCYWPRAQL